ncbi:galactose/methyl galactoside ABC transporter permease MglC [Citroniella saccharovorans]|uniref:Galactose/methyl galactoside ABC transporter permease MglC n=1 Tax=Citroniella saccharovorans TaxID=2053367 RepID=A0AAW9MVX9_9FIRM|nr:galactose/methyl galactoside ABC transporter permease MglC [Citroniella saccharovorans]MEB3428645.1 galactose/methyl galactoside ABC transporter permease MglC [Citroniella saccharovorans]
MKSENKSLAVKKDKKELKAFLLNYSLYIILGIMILGIIIYEPSFLSIKNFTNILTQASTRGILALGVAGLIILQGTDLSAGRILGLSAAVSASLLQSPEFASRMYPNLPLLPMIVPLIASIIIAVLFALVNGFGVAVLKIHAFIITLGTQLIAFGLLQIYIESQTNGAQPIGTLQTRYTELSTGSFLGIPNLVWFLIIVAAIMWVIWNKTEVGKNMFAIGGNPEAAEVSGINLVKNIMIIYLLSGILYGIAGFLEAGRVGSVTSNTGFSYELDAISACVVGGVSFSGGIGTIPGVLIGTIILQFITYGLNYINMNPYLQYIIRGLIIIIAVAIDVRKYIKKK